MSAWVHETADPPATPTTHLSGMRPNAAPWVTVPSRVFRVNTWPRLTAVLSCFCRVTFTSYGSMWLNHSFEGPADLFLLLCFPRSKGLGTSFSSAPKGVIRSSTSKAPSNSKITLRLQDTYLVCLFNIVRCQILDTCNESV